MGWKATYSERGNTNKLLMRRANAIAQTEGKNNEIKLFSEAYKEARANICIRTLSKRESDPVKYVSITNQGGLWKHMYQRVGRPRLRWIIEAIKDIWEIIKDTQTDEDMRSVRINSNMDIKDNAGKIGDYTHSG